MIKVRSWMNWIRNTAIFHVEPKSGPAIGSSQGGAKIRWNPTPSATWRPSFLGTTWQIFGYSGGINLAVRCPDMIRYVHLGIWMIFLPKNCHEQECCCKGLYIYIFNLRSHKQNGFSFACSQELDILPKMTSSFVVSLERSSLSSFVFVLDNPGSG